MSNLRLQNILKCNVQAICKEVNCQPSVGFIHLMLKEVFGLSDIDREEAITDGAMDKGIDAIFEQENEDGENVLYVVQSKYFVNSDKSLDEAAINKAILALQNYVYGDCPLDPMNSRLRERSLIYQEKLSNGGIDSVSLVFLTNGQKISPYLEDSLKKFKEQQNGQVNYEVYYEEDLVQIFAPISAQKVKAIDLKVVKDAGGGDKTYINLPDIDYIQGKVTKVDVVNLAEIVKTNPNIFNSNVRAYRSIKNKVNGMIAKTLKNEETAKQFIYLNNGITILCDSYDPKPGNEVIKIENPSIINGCQTANTVLEVYNEGSLKLNQAFVLVRIIKSTDENVKRSIIISSNTQTEVKNRDLISEDPIQKELEKEFLTLGYYYDRKVGLYYDKPSNKVIDLEKAAQYYLSLYLNKPAEAKNHKREIYTSYRDQIFNKKLSANQLLVGYILYNRIEKEIKQIRKQANADRKSILGNSVLHLLPLFRVWAVEASGRLLSDLEDDFALVDELFEKKFPHVVKNMEASIKKIQTRGKETFVAHDFFRNPSSLDVILKDRATNNNDQPVIEINEEKAGRLKDFRYYKPDAYSLGEQQNKKITHWTDLFVILMDLYVKRCEVVDGRVDFIDSGSRILLLENPSDEEKKFRKRLKNGQWLLTNFDSGHLCRFCFDISRHLDMKLQIQLRPTRFRIEKKLKKR